MLFFFGSSFSSVKVSKMQTYSRLSSSSESESGSVLSNSLRPQRTTQSMEFSRTEHWSGQPFPSPGDLPNPEIELRSPALQVDPLPAEPQEKPKNTGMDSRSLLSGIFPTQELNQGLLHCRQILYQLSYQGSQVCNCILYFLIIPYCRRYNFWDIILLIVLKYFGKEKKFTGKNGKFIYSVNLYRTLY